jgi:phosphatidylserine/phosphatidylglycerophosphate/cardiolipin synthase-like enzyme
MPDNLRKRRYHYSLVKAGVKVSYNEHIHSKIIGIDNRLAIITSMNFTPTSPIGASLEAGLVTWEKNNVEKIFDSISTTLNSVLTKKNMMK